MKAGVYDCISSLKKRVVIGLILHSFMDKISMKMGSLPCKWYCHAVSKSSTMDGKTKHKHKIYKRLLHLNLSRKLSNYPVHISIRYPTYRGSTGNEPTTTIISTESAATFESPAPTSESVSASKFGP